MTDPFPRFGAMVIAVGVAGLFCAWLFCRGLDRDAAFVGVAEATASGALALSLKKWAMARSIKAALGMIGIVFGIRLALAAAGLAYVRVKGGAVLPFVAGFFGSYFVLQWVEIGYVLAESKRRGGLR